MLPAAEQNSFTIDFCYYIVIAAPLVSLPQQTQDLTGTSLLFKCSLENNEDRGSSELSFSYCETKKAVTVCKTIIFSVEKLSLECTYILDCCVITVLK